MSEYTGKRWRTEDRYEPLTAAEAVPKPGKRTLTEQLHRADASVPVQRSASSSPSPTPLPEGLRPTIHELFRGHVQLRAALGVAGEEDTASIHASVRRGIATSVSPLPHSELIQRSFGRHDILGILAHTGREAAASARAMGAEAYATGNHVVLGGRTDLHTVAHEAAHVIQQRGGVRLKSGVGEAGDAYERHADQVADAVVRGQSAECLLDLYAGQHASAHARGGRSGAADGAHTRDASADAGGPATTAPVQRVTDDSQMMLVSLFALLVRLIWHILAAGGAPQQGNGAPAPMAPADRPTPEPDRTQVESVAGELSHSPALRDKVQAARHESGAPDDERIVCTLASDAEVKDTIAKALRDESKAPERMEQDRTAEHVGERLDPSHSASTAPGQENQGTRDEAGSSFDHACHGPGRTSGVAGEPLEPSTEIAGGPVEAFGELLQRCEILCNTIRAHGDRPIPYGLDEERMMLISKTRSRGLESLAGLLEELGLRNRIACEGVFPSHADLFDDQAWMADQLSTSTAGEPNTAGEPSTVGEPNISPQGSARGDASTRGAPQPEPGPSPPRSAKGKEKVTEDDEDDEDEDDERDREQAARSQRNADDVEATIEHYRQESRRRLSTAAKVQRPRILDFIETLNRTSHQLAQKRDVRDAQVKPLKQRVTRSGDAFLQEISTAQTARPTESSEFGRTDENSLHEWIRDHAPNNTTPSAPKRCATRIIAHPGAGEGGTNYKYDNRTVFHVSRGDRAKDNGCTVFFVVTERATIIIIGVGRHLGNTSYDLHWRHPAWGVSDRLAL
jgi:hypothetical protein